VDRYVVVGLLLWAIFCFYRKDHFLFILLSCFPIICFLSIENAHYILPLS